MPKPLRILLLALGGLGLLAAGVYVYVERSTDTPDLADAGPVASLDAWVERTQRPGFILLDKADLEDYHVSVYDTGSREVALCYRWKHAQDAPDTSLVVLDADGRSLQDRGRWDTQTQLNERGLLAADAYVQGMVIPIPPDHQGPIRVVFRDDVGAPDEVPARVVYEKTLPFGP